MTHATVARLLAAMRQVPVSLSVDRATLAPAAAEPAIFRAIRHTPLIRRTGLVGLARQVSVACRSNDS